MAVVSCRELSFMPPSKVCPQWHEFMARRVLHFSAFIAYLTTRRRRDACVMKREAFSLRFSTSAFNLLRGGGRRPGTLAEDAIRTVAVIGRAIVDRSGPSLVPRLSVSFSGGREKESPVSTVCACSKITILGNHILLSITVSLYSICQKSYDLFVSRTKMAVLSVICESSFAVK